MTVRHNIIAMGEILWDVFPDRTCFGGAPANFACACAELGMQAVKVDLFSGVGRDQLGDQAMQQLASHGVSSNLVQRPDKKTGQVQVSLNADGSAAYEFAEDVAWDNLAWSSTLEAHASAADAICFGTLAQRCAGSANAIQQFVNATPPDCLRVFDINLRFPHVNVETIEPSLELCNVLKLNEEELPFLAEHLNYSGSQKSILDQLEQRFALKLIALTLGSDGAILKSGERECKHCPTPIEVVDTVGAGDSFTAALTLALLRSGKDIPDSTKKLESILINATSVAAFVCSQPGATPAFPKELRFDIGMCE